MARFSKVDLDKNIKDLIVPLGLYWLAIDTNKYVIGDGNTVFDDLVHYTYTGQIIEADENVVLDPTQDLSIDGGDEG